MEREIKIDWETSFLEKIIEKIEEVSQKKGFVKRLDIEPQADRRILEFQKGRTNFSVSLDFYETNRSYFVLKGKPECVDIFFEALHLFIKEILKTIKKSLRSKKDRTRFKEILKILTDTFIK